MYCSKCGSVLAENTAFCGSCGAPVGGPALAPVAPVPAGLAGSYSPAPGIIISQVPSYAGFWLRFLAYIIDSLITGIAIFALAIPIFVLSGAFAHLASISRHGGEPDPAAIAAIVSLALTFVGLSLLIRWLYFAYLESGEKQATWGKQVLGLYVTDLTGQRISFGRASGRFFGKLVSGLIPLFIGYVMAGFTEKKQALHDMIASCLVLKR